ncbi:hypothetical protein CJF32_00007137 [Rutstroemia sp. NJR-2017a WRK4]|nr:hypothetical protein CJF32_00007137 [Rutstroemia sp. NJR-2017a WRK4]
MGKTSRPQPDDSEASSTKEKVPTNAGNTTNGKNRRAVTNATGAAGNATSHLATSVLAAAAGSNPENAPGIQWSSFDPAVLHGYRYEWRMNTPAAFNSSYNQVVLSRSSIGRMSPTMARKKEQRRQGKDQLANAIRKHFNSLGVIENEVIIDFLYKVRHQG